MTTVTLLLLAAGLLAGCWVAACVQRVSPEQWTVVTRGGIVRRVFPSGFAWRLPVVERFEAVRDRPHEVPVGVRATTADGVPVLVLAEATVSVAPPAPGTRYADPWPAAELATEETIAGIVTGWSAAELTQTAAAARHPLRRAVRTAVDELGVEVHDLALVEVGLQIDQLVGDHGPD
jgi:regulator of protease activity HflC (stomatin/prohibitin superfamily)